MTESLALTILAAVVTAIVVIVLLRDPWVDHRPFSRTVRSRRRARPERPERPRHRRAA